MNHPSAVLSDFSDRVCGVNGISASMLRGSKNGHMQRALQDGMVGASVVFYTEGASTNKCMFYIHVTEFAHVHFASIRDTH